MRRYLFRIPAVLLIVLGVLCLAAGATWSIWQPRLLERAAGLILERTGVQIAVFGARPTLGGHVHVASFRAVRGPVSAECADVDVQIGLGAALRGQIQLQSVRIDRCDVQIGAEANAPGPAEPDAHPERLIPSPDRAFAALDGLSAHVETLSVGTLRVARDGDRATITELSVATEPAAHASGVLDAAVHDLVVQGAPFAMERQNETFVVSSSGALAYDDLRLGAGSLRWSRDAVTVVDATVTRSDLSVATIASASFSGDRTCPRIRLHDAAVDVPERWLPAALLAAPAPDAVVPDSAVEADETEPQPPPRPDSPDAGQTPVWTGESPGQRMLRRSGELARRIDGWMGALPMERCFELEIRDSTVRAGRIDATIAAASRDRSGLLRVDGRIAELDVRIDADGRRLEWAELAISGINLSRLLGGDAGDRTAGEVELGGRLIRLPGDELRFRGAVHLRDAGLENDAISPVPLTGINARLAVESRVRIRDDIGISIVASGAVDAVPVSGDLRLEPVGTTHRLTLDAGVSGPVPCQSMWLAVPAGMVPNLTHEGVRFSGEASPRLSVRYDLAAPTTFSMTAGEFLGPCTIEHVRREYDPRRLNQDSFVHHVTEGVTVDDVFVGPGSDSWVPLDSVPGYVPAAMYLSEEINFFTNPGISIGLMNRGMRLNLERMRYAYGGSTVSQQLVKNLFLSRSKTLSRKLEEAVIVMAMERWVSKYRILELYMNCIEYGPNLYGVGRAARHYFGVDASELTPLEAVFLANLKPSPLSGARHLLRGHTPETGWWPERTAEMLQRLVDYGGFIDAGEVAHYAPWVIALPGESGEPRSAYSRIARPDWVSPKDRRGLRDLVSIPEPAP